MTQRVQMTHAALNVLMDVVAQIESPQTEDEMVPPHQLPNGRRNLDRDERGDLEHFWWGH